MKPRVKVALIQIAFLLVALFLIESSLGLLIGARPGQAILAKSIRQYYTWEREAIQFMKDCAEYDPVYTYRFKPGVCKFEGREFSTEVTFNNKGFRSPEIKDLKPEAVVLGDSFAMGWGVADDQTFSSILQSRGFSILNAAQSSFATARELRLLKDIDLSNLKYLVIQYNEGDYTENKLYLESEKLPVLEQKQYENKVQYFELTRPYYPGKYLERFLPGLFWRIIGSKVDQRNYADEARAFKDVLLKSPVDLSGKHLVIFELSNNYLQSDNFIDELGKYSSELVEKLDLLEVTLLPISAFLGGQYYFYYDDHLNATGHLKVADILENQIREIQ